MEFSKRDVIVAGVALVIVITLALTPLYTRQQEGGGVVTVATVASVATATVEVLDLKASVLDKKNKTETVEERVKRILSSNPLIDGHNDLAMSVRGLLQNNVDLLNLDQDLSKQQLWSNPTDNHTDIPRLRKGQVGGVFWSAYADCETQYKDAVRFFIEQVRGECHSITRINYLLK